MKKILLLIALIISVNLNAQFSKETYGWKFESSRNTTLINDTKVHREGPIEFYYFRELKAMQVVYVDGSKENYKVSSKYPESSGTTEGGYKYNVYRMIDLSDNKIVQLQVFEDMDVMRLVYVGGYVEFY